MIIKNVQSYQNMDSLNLEEAPIRSVSGLLRGLIKVFILGMEIIRQISLACLGFLFSNIE